MVVVEWTRRRLAVGLLLEAKSLQVVKQQAEGLVAEVVAAWVAVEAKSLLEAAAVLALHLA